QFGGFQPLMTELQAHPGQTVHLGVVRAGGALVDVPVTLRPANEIDATHKALGVGFVAFRASPIGFTRNPVDALATGAARTEEAFRLIADGLGQIANSIATKPTEAPPASGPIGIAVQVGDVFWQAGPIATLYLAGILSANLALVNVLPFPPLDGGRMLMLVIKRPVGSRHPIVVQSMTNTDTADPDATALQVAQLAHAGSELVRVTVNTEAAAAAVPEIIRRLHDLGVGVPVIGDFHYNGHVLLTRY